MQELVNAGELKTIDGCQALDAKDKAAALVKAFLSGRNPRTLDAYRRDLADFRRFTGQESLDKATLLLLARGHGEANFLALSYKAHLIERGLSPATVNRRLAALRSLVKMAGTLGIIPWALDVANVKAKAYRDTRGPAIRTVQMLLEIASGDSPKSRRDVAIIRLLFDLGLRRGEAAGLDVEDVDLVEGTLAVRAKGHMEKDLLTLPTQTRKTLANLLEVRGTETGPLLINFDRAGKSPKGRLTGTSIYRLVRDLGVKAGVKCWPHALRHTSITAGLQLSQSQGLPIEAVKDFSRHASLETVLIYRDKDRDYQGQIASLVASQVKEV